VLDSGAVPPSNPKWKTAAIECWTADPCGASTAAGEPGSREYFERLLQSRREYGPWMAEALDYAGTTGLDVLDVGCGQGIDLANYARAGARVTGIDLTPRHVELANLHLPALDLPGGAVEGDAESLPFADESFDRVSSNGVLHHTPDMPAALREIHRVLRPGGEARIIVYNRNSFHYWLTQVAWLGLAHGWLMRERSMEGVLARGVERSSIGARPLVRVFSPRALRRQLVNAGFGSVTSFVYHFNASDTPITAALERRLAALRDPHVLDRIGRRAGWYVVGIGVRSSG
jgi:ubiquinone/menaquinone biosynthesis C-methylase UbiE